MNNSKHIFFALALTALYSWLATPGAHAAVEQHSIAPGATQGQQIEANGDIHIFRANLSKTNPEKTVVVRGTTYWKVNEDANYYYSASLQWVLPGGLTGHPAWAQTAELPPVGSGLGNRFEVTTQNPGVLQNNLGYLITVKGKRVRVGTGGGGGGGEVVEEDWGSSFTGQAIEGFNPSTEETVNDVTKTMLGSGTVEIRGVATVGQKVDLTHYPFSYTLQVKRGNDAAIEIHSSGTMTAPIIHSVLANWDVDEQKPDGTRKFPAGDYVVTLTVTPGNQGGSGGTATANVTISDPVVTFTGLARSCAGGVAVDGVHDFTVIAEAKQANGTVLSNTEFKFSFKNNKGHDYSDDPLKPAGWTAAQIKRAKFVTMVNGTQQLVEEMTATTDTEGKVNVHVLSSDIISGDIQIQVRRANGQDTEKVIGSKVCDFAAVLNYRRFGIIGEEGDTGWKFDDELLFDGRGDKSPAKLWLKIQKDPARVIDTDYFQNDGVTPRQPQDWDNWQAVRGHRLKLRISEILLANGASVDPDNFSDYISIVTEADVPVSEMEVTTTWEGSAQVWLKATAMIKLCKSVQVIADELTQVVEDQ